MKVVNLANLQQFTAVNFSSDPGAIGGPVIIPQCAVIRLGWSLEDGRVATNVLHGRYSGTFAGTTAQANQIMTALSTGAQWTALAAFFATTNSLINVAIQDVNTAYNPFINSNVPGSAGSSASPSIPNEVAVVITLRTAQVGRGFRGRIYVPGWATNAMGSGNVVAAAAVTALGNWANTIPTALSAAGYTFVIGQKERAAYPGSTGTSHPHRDANTVQITQQVVRDNHWDTQRRRGLK